MKLLKVPAETGSLDRVNTFIKEELGRCGCPMKSQMPVALAVEEIFVNIASYAYQPEKGEAEISVDAVGDPPTVTIHFLDRGKPFNSLVKPDADTSLSAEERGAFLLATLRGVVFPLPLIPLLLALDGDAYWWLYPVSEAGTLLAFLLTRRWWEQPGRTLEEGRVYHRIIGIREDDIAAVLADAEAFCDRWEANPKQAYFVTMTVEELCTIIVKKGFQEKDGFLQVTLVAQPDGDFSLYIRDSAVSFDPFSLETKGVNSAAWVDMDAMGVLDIRQKAKEFFYRRYQGFNSLVVRI